jgi:hypothetical protein
LEKNEMVEKILDLANLYSTQGFEITGAIAGDNSGFAVSSAGDMNGDGYGDIVIGAREADPYSRSKAGTSYVIYGKSIGFSNMDLANLNSTQGFAIYGASAGDLNGFAVSSAGDMNGDGYGDIVIGAREADPYSRNDAGTSYVIFGKSSMISNIDLVSLNSSNGFAIYGAAAGDYSGSSVALAGDVNGDGYDDIIIGAKYASPYSRNDAGASYVIFGKSSMISNIDLVNLNSSDGFAIYGANSYDVSGWSVSSAGDVNGDGYDDIVLGALDVSPYSRTEAGASYVVYGKSGIISNIDLANLDSSIGFAIYGAVAGDKLGRFVSSAGDFNRDGYADVIVGTHDTDVYSRTEAGTAYVVYGKSSMISNIDLANFSNSSDGFAIYGAAAGDHFGRPVTSAGDINGDGYADVIIGANSADPDSRTNAGTSYVIYGKSGMISNIDLANNLTSSDGFIIYGANSNDQIGIGGLASAGDFNGDNYTDIIVGTHLSDPGGKVDAGTSYVIFGAESGYKTDAPTSLPTVKPTSSMPSAYPSTSPTAVPSFIPSVTPSGEPTYIPTAEPSPLPTAKPSIYPTSMPSSCPSAEPTNLPSSIPSLSPSSEPTYTPTSSPSERPLLLCVKNGEQGKTIWADFNGDGKIDYICQYNDSSVRVCLSTGRDVDCSIVGDLYDVDALL